MRAFRSFIRWDRWDHGYRRPESWVKPWQPVGGAIDSHSFQVAASRRAGVVVVASLKNAPFADGYWLASPPETRAPSLFRFYPLEVH
jgi:hypothetical protein